jgi:predicted nucleotidyltransferase
MGGGWTRLTMADEKTISRAAAMLLAAAPGATVILFGSHARGDARPDSDVDFLVVEPEVTSSHMEMVRLRTVLRDLDAPVDVFVVSRETFDEWRDTPNTAIYEAARRGKVYEQVA